MQNELYGLPYIYFSCIKCRRVYTRQSFVAAEYYGTQACLRMYHNWGITRWNPHDWPPI
jgi:hypothetical protein